MLLNEIVHTITACQEYSFSTSIAGRRICELILFHRENGTSVNEPVIILQTGIKEGDYSKDAIGVFYELAESLGSAYYHLPNDGSVWLIGTEQETKTIMESWYFLWWAYDKYRRLNRKWKGYLEDTFDVFIGDVIQFPEIYGEQRKIKNILLAQRFDVPPAKMIPYEEHAIPDDVPSDVHEGCTIEFCYEKKAWPKKKIRSFNSIYHEDNSYRVPVIARGIVYRQGDNLRVRDNESGRTHSLNKSKNRIYVRDIL